MAEDGCGGGDAQVTDAARVDQLELGQVWLEIHGEAMQGDAVALGDADGRDFPGFGPDADVAFVDPRGNAN